MSGRELLGVAKGFVLPGLLISAACQSVAEPDGATPEMLDLETVASAMPAYEGRDLKLCGDLVPHEPGVWLLLKDIGPKPRPAKYWHGAPGILVVPCGTSAPKQAKNMCVSGRVARRLGSPHYPNRGPIYQTSDPFPDQNWFVHQSCPAKT